MPVRPAYVIFAILYGNLCVGQEDSCTSGFMSVDRMERVLDSTGSLRVRRDYLQIIYPEVQFTCSGAIRVWIFGARWSSDASNLHSFPELQIWRPSRNGGFIKVGSTTVTVRRPSTTQFYHYTLSSPLRFQEGDFLGYYQPPSQLRVLFERDGRRRQLQYTTQSANPSTVLFISDLSPFRTSQILIRAVTDTPGCGYGFISEERIRLLLGLEQTADPMIFDRRQQITPSMRFTCDGMITKWITGADYRNAGDDNLYPEFQIWRDTGNGIYRKIGGTLIVTPIRNEYGIYEYDNFSPVPFKAGDIFGAFLPIFQFSRIRVQAETMTRPLNFYQFIESQSQSGSPLDTINIDNEEVMSTTYHPLVTVEIVRSSPSPTSAMSSIKSSSSYRSSSFVLSQFESLSVVTLLSSGSTSTPLRMTTTEEVFPLVVSSSLPARSSRDQFHNLEDNDVMFIIVGVSVAVVVLCGVIMTVITVTVLVRRKKKRDIAKTATDTDSQFSRAEFSMTANTAHDEDYVITENYYSYAAQPTTIAAHMTSNTAYNYSAHNVNSEERNDTTVKSSNAWT